MASVTPGASSSLCELGGVHADPGTIAPELAARRQSGRGPPGRRAVARDRLVWALWTQDGGAASCDQRKAFGYVYLSTGASTGRGGHDLPKHPPGGPSCFGRSCPPRPVD